MLPVRLVFVRHTPEPGRLSPPLAASSSSAFSSVLPRLRARLSSAAAPSSCSTGLPGRSTGLREAAQTGHHHQQATQAGDAQLRDAGHRSTAYAAVRGDACTAVCGGFGLRVCGGGCDGVLPLPPQRKNTRRVFGVQGGSVCMSSAWGGRQRAGGNGAGVHLQKHSPNMTRVTSPTAVIPSTILPAPSAGLPAPLHGSRSLVLLPHVAGRVAACTSVERLSYAPVNPPAHDDPFLVLGFRVAFCVQAVPVQLCAWRAPEKSVT